MLGQHKPPFSVYSIHAWWTSWRMEPWIFNHSENMKEDNVYSFYYFLLTREVVPVLPAEESYISSDACSCAKAVFHAPALVNASQRTEERLMSALCSRSIFPFWLFARGEGNIMTFLTTPNYLDSLLPWEQRPLKNKTSAELLLLRGSQVIALDKSHLAHFSLSFLLSCTCSFPLINQKANTLPWILSECAQLSVRARGICQSWFCCFMYALCLFHLILEFHVLKIS